MRFPRAALASLLRRCRGKLAILPRQRLGLRRCRAMRRTWALLATAMVMVTAIVVVETLLAATWSGVASSVVATCCAAYYHVPPLPRLRLLHVPLPRLRLRHVPLPRLWLSQSQASQAEVVVEAEVLVVGPSSEVDVTRSRQRLVCYRLNLKNHSPGRWEPKAACCQPFPPKAAASEQSPKLFATARPAMVPGAPPQCSRRKPRAPATAHCNFACLDRASNKNSPDLRGFD